MKAQLQNFYILRLTLDAEERRFLQALCKQANIQRCYTELPDGAIILDEDQIRAVRLALASHKPRNLTEQAIHRDFWECMPDFLVLSEQRNPYYDDIPLKAAQSNRGASAAP